MNVTAKAWLEFTFDERMVILQYVVSVNKTRKAAGQGS